MVLIRIRGEGAARGGKGRSTTDERTRHDSAKQETGSAKARAGHATEILRTPSEFAETRMIRRAQLFDDATGSDTG